MHPQAHRQADGGTFGAAANGVPPVSVNVSEGPFVYLHCTCVRSARTCLCEAIWHVCLLHMWTCGAHTQMASYVYLCSASLWCARLCVSQGVHLRTRVHRRAYACVWTRR